MVEAYLAGEELDGLPEQYREAVERFLGPLASPSDGGGGGGKPGARTEDVVTELEIVKGELQGLRADLIAAVNSLANRPIAVNGKIITDIVGQGILRKARATFG